MSHGRPSHRGAWRCEHQPPARVPPPRHPGAPRPAWCPHQQVGTFPSYLYWGRRRNAAQVLGIRAELAQSWARAHKPWQGLGLTEPDSTGTTLAWLEPHQRIPAHLPSTTARSASLPMCYTAETGPLDFKTILCSKAETAQAKRVAHNRPRLLEGAPGPNTPLASPVPASGPQNWE